MITQPDIQKLKSEFTTKDDFYTMMDKVMGELQGIREDITVFSYRQGNHNDRLESIENKVFGKTFT